MGRSKPRTLGSMARTRCRCVLVQRSAAKGHTAQGARLFARGDAPGRALVGVLRVSVRRPADALRQRLGLLHRVELAVGLVRGLGRLLGRRRRVAVHAHQQQRSAPHQAGARDRAGAWVSGSGGGESDGLLSSGLNARTSVLNARESSMCESDAPPPARHGLVADGGDLLVKHVVVEAVRRHDDDVAGLRGGRTRASAETVEGGRVRVGVALLTRPFPPTRKVERALTTTSTEVTSALSASSGESMMEGCDSW